MSNKKLQSEKRKAKLWCTVRVSSETRKMGESLLKVANEKTSGRKVKLDEILQSALALVQPRHIEVLQERSLTNEDRKEILRQKYIAARGLISKDEFTGFMMTSDFIEFLKETDSVKTIAASYS